MATPKEIEDAALESARRGEGISGNPEVDGFDLRNLSPGGPNNPRPQDARVELQPDGEYRLPPLGAAPSAPRDFNVDLDGKPRGDSLQAGVRYGEGDVYAEARATAGLDGRVDGFGVGMGAQVNDRVRVGIEASEDRFVGKLTVSLGDPASGASYRDSERDVSISLVPPVGQLPPLPLTEPVKFYRPPEEKFTGNPDLNRPNQPTGIAAEVQAGRVPGLAPYTPGAASLSVDPNLRAQAEAHIHRINEGLPENARLPLNETAQSLAGTAELRGLPRIGYVELGNPGADGERRLFLGAEASARDRQPGADQRRRERCASRLVGRSDGGLGREARAGVAQSRRAGGRAAAAGDRAAIDVAARHRVAGWVDAVS